MNELKIIPQSKTPALPGKPSSFDFDKDFVQETINLIHSKNTRRSYSCYWKQFRDFAEENSFDPLLIDQTHVIGYITYRIKVKKSKISTIRFALAAMKNFIGNLDPQDINAFRKHQGLEPFDADDYIDAIDSRRVKKLLEGENASQKQNDDIEIKKASPFSDQEFLMVLAHLRKDPNKTRAQFRTLYLSLLFYGAARASEVLNTKAKHIYYRDNCQTWELPTSKAAKEPTFKSLPSSELLEFSTFHLVNEFCKVHGLGPNDYIMCATFDRSGKIKIRRDDKGITKRIAHSSLHKDFKKVFIEVFGEKKGGTFSLHSPRRSFINSRLRQGWTVDDIIKQTLQSGEVVRRFYTENDTNLKTNKHNEEGYEIKNGVILDL